ncbi:efflux RND transporter periplasmic adaptor subunit [Bordetella genomosp. 8]|uniref:efflux RND transporter periplasmic adaptor subunit n=1 Tax=Bordetella genomosp. 8 TaxID=1416806 RepID=UPI001E2B5E98|nr:efflux RND transporter periplasmic adaptor subunit [Bordetella genomosp. 8]
MKTLYVGTLAAAAAVAVVTGASYLWSGTPAVAAAPAALPEVTVATPLVRQLDSRMGALGQFSAVNQLELRPQVGGTLTGIFFRDGDVVQKGALLFTIDPKPYEIRLARAKAQLDTARARLALADSELRRAVALEQGAAGTVQNSEQRRADRQVAQAAIAAANAEVDDAQFDLDRCRITAPFTGRIGNHLVSVGNLVAGSRAASSPTTLLATLVSLDPIYLNFDLSEADYQSLSRYRADHPGQASDAIELALGGDKAYSRIGKFDFINNVLDRASGTIHARATVPNASLRLTPGEFARVRVVVDQPTTALLVPDASVLPDQSRHIVLVVAKDGTVTPKGVQVGDIRSGLRVIRSGLAPDDQVIVGGLPYATPGAKVATRTAAIEPTADRSED